jgi:hypothetical protein
MHSMTQTRAVLVKAVCGKSSGAADCVLALIIAYRSHAIVTATLPWHAGAIHQTGVRSRGLGKAALC